MTKVKKPVLLLLGPEEGEKTKYIKAAVKKWTNGDPQPEVHKYYAFENNLEDVVSESVNGSLFSEKKVVIIDGIEQLKKKGDVKLISYFIKSLPENTLLILTSSQISIDTKINGLIDQKNKKIFWELFQNKKNEWISSFFRERKIDIDREAIEGILDLVENNTEELNRECEKLAVFFGEKAVIHPEDIEEFIYHGKEENVYSLFEKISNRDFISSLEVLEKISNSGISTPIGLTAGLVWQFRTLLSIIEIQAKYHNEDEVFEQLRIRGKKRRKTFSIGSNNYSQSDCRKIILLLGKADADFRSTPTECHSHLIKMLLFRLTNTNSDKN